MKYIPIIEHSDERTDKAHCIKGLSKSELFGNFVLPASAQGGIRPSP
jgi:hypothetical protein